MADLQNPMPLAAGKRVALVEVPDWLIRFACLDLVSKGARSNILTPAACWLGDLGTCSNRRLAWASGVWVVARLAGDNCRHTDGEDERVAGLQDAREPAVALQAQLLVAGALLRRQHAAHQQGRRRTEVPHQLAGHACVVRIALTRLIQADCGADYQKKDRIYDRHTFAFTV